MAWSPYKDRVISYVASHPGCCKWDVAAHVAYACHPSKLYYIVNTAIRNGWIVASRKGNRYQLFPKAAAAEATLQSAPSASVLDLQPLKVEE